MFKRKTIIANYNYTTNRRIQEKKNACVSSIDDISCSAVYLPSFNIFTGLISSCSIFIFRHLYFVSSEMHNFLLTKPTINYKSNSITTKKTIVHKFQLPRSRQKNKLIGPPHTIQQSSFLNVDICCRMTVDSLLSFPLRFRHVKIGLWKVLYS